jgi:hypothetical protein
LGEEGKRHIPESRAGALDSGLAVMAKEPSPAMVKTRLAPAIGDAGRQALARAFLLDAVDRLRTVPGLAVYVSYSPPDAEHRLAVDLGGTPLFPQRGTDLGERMSNALGDLFERGHRAAILLGTDSPNLPLALVIEAMEALRDGVADLVLGPAQDGGYYLVGLCAPAPDLFRGIPWSTGEVLPATLAAARRLGLRTHPLGAWYDVDTPEDLLRLAHDLAHAPREAADFPRRTAALLRKLVGG